MTNMNKTNLKMMLLAGLFALAGTAGFTACSSDDDKGETPEEPTEEQHQKPVTAYDDLAYFQSSIVCVDSLGRFIERNYGEPLYDNDTTTVYVGVETLAEAREMFDGWLAPDVKVTAQTPSTTDVTATLTDKEGKAQGEVYFKAVNDGTTIAEVTTTAAVRHFRKVSFIPNSAWPHNVQEGKFVKGMIVNMRICYGMETGVGGDIVYKNMNMVCVRSQAKGVAPLFAGISKEKIRSASFAYAFTSGTEYHTNISSSDLANEKDAQDICDLVRADWDLFVGIFNQAGEGPLTTTDYYWIKAGGSGFMHDYQSAMNLSTKETSDFEITWSGSEFYGLYVKKSGFYMKYDPVQYVECSWDDTNKTVVKEEKTLEEYYWLTGQTDDWVYNEGNWYAITGEDVKLDVLQFGHEDNHLVICDGAKLTLRHLKIPQGTELTIYGGPKGTGLIYVDNDDDDDDNHPKAAGIGAGSGANMGKLTIMGGKIYARGAKYAAGIGGGIKGNGGTVTIYGGQIQARGGQDGAGIGGGEDGDSGDITIYGGVVHAYGYPSDGLRDDSYGAGIGSGQNGNVNTIKVYGGIVMAYGGMDAAGIGTGEEYGSQIWSGQMYFHGGQVLGEGHGYGAGIGAGEDATCGGITISGGRVDGHAGHQCGNWSGGIGAYHSEHEDGCHIEWAGWQRIYIGACMRLFTYTPYNGYVENVHYTENWWNFVHQRPQVAFGECNHVDGAYDITNCPYCHSYTLTLQ